MNRPYVIWTPQYGRNAGVQALYKLAQELTLRGQQVYIWTWGTVKRPGFTYLTSFTPELRNEGIVVYPETAIGNPLRFRRVCRWVLFFPGELWGEKQYYPDEKIFTWRPEYYPGVPKLYVNLVDKSLFYNNGSEKKHDYVFMHKGGKTCQKPELENIPVISMTWPKTRAELGEVLRSCRTLYSFDPHTSILDEAYYSGAEVKIITPDGEYADFHPSLVFDQAVFDQEITAFINETQNMPPSTELQPLPSLSVRIMDGLRCMALKYGIIKQTIKKFPAFESRMRSFFKRGVSA